MASEAGHHVGRCFIGQDGNFYLNGAAIFNDNGDDVSGPLESLDQISTTELEFLDGAVAGTPAAAKVLMPDANLEINGIGVIKKADVLIATAAVLTLNTTPVEVIPAPAAGTYHEFLGAYVFLDYAGTAYAADAGEDLCLRYTDSSGDVVSTDIDGEEFEATADALFIMSPVPTAPNVITHAAAAIVAHNKVGNWATGNSPLKIRAYYRVIRKAALEAIA